MNKGIQYATGEELRSLAYTPERIKQLGQSSTVYKIGNQQGPIS